MILFMVVLISGFDCQLLLAVDGYEWTGGDPTPPKK